MPNNNLVSVNSYGGSGWLPLRRPESRLDPILKWEGDWAEGLEEEDQTVRQIPVLGLPLFVQL
ncbi:hypothetical protein V8C44DRAFT_332715 [Trichoderma aethiopicum]